MCSLLLNGFLLIVLISMFSFVVMIFLIVMCFVRILIIDRLKIEIINSLGDLKRRMIGCVMRIKIVRKVVFISFLNSDEVKVVDSVCVVWLCLVMGKLFRIVV